MSKADVHTFLSRQSSSLYCGRNHQSLWLLKKKLAPGTLQTLVHMLHFVLFCFQVLWVPGDLPKNLFNKATCPEGLFEFIYLNSSAFWESHPLF